MHVTAVATMLWHDWYVSNTHMRVAAVTVSPGYCWLARRCWSWLLEARSAGRLGEPWQLQVEGPGPLEATHTFRR